MFKRLTNCVDVVRRYFAGSSRVVFLIEGYPKGKGINSGPALAPFTSLGSKIHTINYHVASDLGSYVAFVVVFRPTATFSVGDAYAHLKKYGTVRKVAD